MEMGRRQRDTIAASLAHLHCGEALGRGDAVLVGNLAGIVEWTGEAWFRLTGFPLEETIAKPITHFLDRAGIETELVEFIAQRFLEGSPCTVELPFETFDGRRIDAHLEVTPLRGEDGEIERFIAVASDVTSRVTTENVDHPPTIEPTLRPEARQTPITVPPPVTNGRAEGPRCDLRAAIERTLRGLPDDQRSAGHFELGIAPGFLPPVTASRNVIDALLRSLVLATTQDEQEFPRFVSVLAGALVPRRSHHSEVHPIPVRATARLDRAHAFVEVHDTGPPLSVDALARIRTGKPGPDARECGLARAAETARRIGGMLHLDSTLGCGNQSLLVLPFAAGAWTAGEHRTTDER